MANDLASVTSGIQTLQNLVTINPADAKNFILVTPGRAGYKPLSSIIGGVSTVNNDEVFVFNYEGEQKQMLSADITDHPIEDNSFLNDHVAIRPERFQTAGYIGELNDIVPEFLEPLKFIEDKLTIVSAYTPALSAAALVAMNRAVRLYTSATKAISTAKNTFKSLFGGERELNNQQIAYKKLKGYMKSRTLFTVQTPWSIGSEILQNMMIESITVIQDDTSETDSTFEVVFKQVRFASSIKLESDNFGKTRTKEELQQRGALQNSDQVNHGSSAGAAVNANVSQLVGRIS